MLELHRKFRAPCHIDEPFWHSGANGTISESIPWPANILADTRGKKEWNTFISEPFPVVDGYENYVTELAKIASTFKDIMKRKDSKGNTALKILQNGSSRSHYEYLQNSSRLMTHLGEKRGMLGTGTTRNEQLHRELKSWGTNIRMAHLGRLKTGLAVFGLAKLLTHSSANFSPTLTQVTQQRLLSQIAGQMRKIKFFPPPLNDFTHKKSLRCHTLHTPQVPVCNDRTAKRKDQRRKNDEMWVKAEIKSKTTHPNETNVFKRRRVKHVIP